MEYLIDQTNKTDWEQGQPLSVISDFKKIYKIKLNKDVQTLGYRYHDIKLDREIL